MPANNYRLVSHWRVPGTTAEVSEILGDPTSLPRWWGSVYREVEQIDPGDQAGAGRAFTVRAAGWLPYSLRLRFAQMGERTAEGFAVAVRGDLNGTGVWKLAQRGDKVDVTFEWTVQADKPILRRFSWLMKPIFASNHHWTMRRGEESLRIELQCLHASTDEERALVQPRPERFRPGLALALLGGAAAVTGVSAVMIRAVTGRRER